MFYVYFLRTASQPYEHYTGFTSRHPEERMAEHVIAARNDNRSWELISYVAFTEEQAAQDFEKYVKKGSGWALAHKRFFGTKNKE